MRGRSEAAVELRPDEAEASCIRPRRRRDMPHLALLRSPDPPERAETRPRRASSRLEGGSRAIECSTDGELVTLALNGGMAAFAHLMRRHDRHLHAVIARRLRDPEDVRDAVQDTHFAVWRALQHYDAGRPFEAWITTIALNKCRDWARRRATQLGMLSRLKSDVLHEGCCGIEECGIERQLIGNESLCSLGRALEDLPPQLLAPLLLTAVREHSQAAAARELGLTRKAVEMRVRRARQHLALALEASHG